MTANSLTNFQRIFFFISLGIATFMVSIDYAIANISIPYIAGDLAISNDEGTYVITWFAVGNAIGLALTGWLTKRIGAIKLLLLSIGLFTFFSWLCGFSCQLNMLVICRFLQGLSGGPIVPLAQSLIIEYGTPKTRRMDLTIWAGIIITAPVLGPIGGGYISYWYSWPWIFYINIPIGIFCILAIYMLAIRTNNLAAQTEQPPGDCTGVILLVIGVACLQIFLDKGQQWDWFNSPSILLLMAGWIAAFTYFIIWELWRKNPLLNLRLFRHNTFTLSIISLVVSYALYFGSIVLIPLWLQEFMGYDAVWAGIAVAALGVGPLLLSIFSPIAIRKFGNTRTLIFGFFLFGIACFFTANFTTGATIQHIAFARFLFGLALVFYVNPLIGMSVEEIPQEQLPNAASIFHFIRSLVGGIGTAIFKTLWERRTVYHHEVLGSNLTPFNPSTPSVHTNIERMQLNQLVDHQASLLALNDTFYLMAWCFMALGLCLLLFYLKNQASKQSKCKPAAFEAL